MRFPRSTSGGGKSCGAFVELGPDAGFDELLAGAAELTQHLGVALRHRWCTNERG
jgi:hypothetical protein